MNETATSSATGTGVKLTAMVIDDSRAARTLVGNMLGKLGFQVEAAEHGRDALDKLVELAEPPAAVVVDWNMPVMDGVEFAKEFRKHEKFKTTPLLMISSESDPRRVASALLAGIDEYLFKPVDSEMIRERLGMLGLYVGEG